MVGQIEPEKFQLMKRQVTNYILELARSPDLSRSISAYIHDALEEFRHLTLGSALQRIDLNSAERLKGFLSGSLLEILARHDTAQTINAIMNSQVEQLLIAPIGKLGDHLSEHSVQRAREMLVERITNAARERLPTAIAEFDVGGLVRKKVSDYPVEKLEELVLSVASQHLKTIELFGAIIGFIIGVGQALYLWFGPAIVQWLNRLIT